MGLMDNFRKANIDKLKATAVEYDRFVHTFDRAADVLVDAHNRGENIFIDFNGTKLYSVEIANVDDAYMQYMGTTKAEHEAQVEAQRQKWEEERTRAEAAAKAKIPDWVERGNKVIMPDMEETWKQCVEIRANDLYHGAELENALQIMEALAKGATMEEALAIFDSANHSGMSAGVTKSIILSFCEQGVDFYRAETERYTKLNEAQEQRLDAQKRENEIRFGKYDEQEMKMELITSLKATQSWIKPDMMRDLLSPEQQEVLDNAVEKKDRISFCVRPSKDGGYEFREFFALDEAVTIPIDPDKISLEKLAEMTEAAMIPHLQYGTWHATSTLAKPAMVEAKLQSTIEIAHQVARVEHEKGVENSVGNDVLSSDGVVQNTPANENAGNREEGPENNTPNTDDIGDPDDR